MPKPTSPRDADVSTKKVRVAVETNDPWRRTGLETFLRSKGFAIGGQPAELLLVDVPAEPEDISEQLDALRSRIPSAKLLVLLPTLKSSLLEPCLAAGALGVVAFDADPTTLLSAAAVVSRGNVWAPRNLMAKVIEILSDRPQVTRGPGTLHFSPAERLILRALRHGLTNKEIAKQLGKSEGTVKFHIGRLLRRTGTASRHELIREVKD